MTEIPGITEEQLIDLTGLVKRVHGFDFSEYSRASLKRRLSRIIMLRKMSFAELKNNLQTESPFFQWFLEEITVNVTEMFRDPFFYRALNAEVIPGLAAAPHIRVWSAGCSSGEEVYSLAILLAYAGLGEKSFIYGTDIHSDMLAEARKGIYNMRKIKSYEGNYTESGLPGHLTEHFTLMNDVAGIRPELKHNTLFSSHNLISDPPFNEFHLISCRNVFIYFEAALQERILHTFYDSLCPSGYLCLGAKETIRFPEMKHKFRVVNSKMNIFQKIDG